MALTSFWDSFTQSLQQETGSAPGGLFAWLKAKLDLAQSRPQAAPGVEISELTGREGVYYILKNPATQTYFRLGPREYFLWQRLDGTRTVKDLVVAYFTEYQVFAFARVTTLLDGLKSKSFLTEPPVDVYAQVRGQLRRRTRAVQFSDVWAGFIEKRFTIEGLDAGLTQFYKQVGWVAYTRWAQILFLLIILIGGVCFSLAAADPRYQVATVGGNYFWGLLSFLSVFAITFFCHELGHALTVKHYGRQVLQGGFMIYFGAPAFFVDTMDMWMAGKRARLAVTWAGPHVDLILGGLAGLVMWSWPNFALNPWLYQFALFNYVIAFFNLNPLLELDGYFLLMDWLEIPMLRHKALDFIRVGLWAKLKSLRENKKSLKDQLTAFSREEKIFAIFGLLSALWSVYAIFQGFTFWQKPLTTLARDLWASGWVGQTVAVISGVGLAGVIAFSAGLFLLNLVQRIVALATRWGLFATPWRLTLSLLGLGLVVINLPVWLGYPTILPVISLATLALALYLTLTLVADYSGSRLAPFFGLVGVAVSLFALHEVGQLILNSWPPVLLISAYIALFAAALQLFADTNLRDLHRAEKVGLVLGGLASYGMTIGIAIARSAAGAPWWDSALAALGGLPLLTTVFLLPTLVAFWRTGFGPAWTILGLAALALLGTGLLGLSPLWAYALLAIALGLHKLGFTRPISWQAAKSEVSAQQSDHDRLRQAFGWTALHLQMQLRELAGDRQTSVLFGQFNTYATAAGWRVQVATERVDDTLPAEFTLRQRGDLYAPALTLLLDLLARQVGEKFTSQMLQRAYDVLPWETREVAAQYLFPDVKRAQILSRQFENTQNNYLSLVQRMPLFATMDATELDLLCSRLKVERLKPGQGIIRQGERGDKFYIVNRGHIEVSFRDAQGISKVVDQHDRGGYIGQVALLNDAPRNATCYATVPTEVLTLSRADFDQLVKARFALREKMDESITRANLLRRMPMFADMDARQVQLIAAQLVEADYAPNAVIIQQGELGDTFHVIESGRVQISITTDGKEQVVSERGPGEYIGEIALLLQVPRVATVRALTAVRTLTLSRQDFDQLIAQHLYASKTLEREMSRSMNQLRQVAQVA